MIFSELYSTYYKAVAAVLKEAAAHPLSQEELRATVRGCVFGEGFVKIEDALLLGDWPLLTKDGASALTKTPEQPLTLLEKRWITAIRRDPRVRLFGDCLPDFPGVEPLFDENDYAVFDRYDDGDDYLDEAYVRRFRLILEAIRGKKTLHFTMTDRKGKRRSFSAVPEKLEYSEKDDKFRLLARSGKSETVINLGRIESCALAEKQREYAAAAPRRRAVRTLEFEVTDERQALERVLLHFAHFEKEAERIGENRYRVSLKYDVADELELVIRILSFGPFVKVTAPESFREKIKERLIKQKSCEQA